MNVLYELYRHEEQQDSRRQRFALSRGSAVTRRSQRRSAAGPGGTDGGEPAEGGLSAQQDSAASGQALQWVHAASEQALQWLSARWGRTRSGPKDGGGSDESGSACGPPGSEGSGSKAGSKAGSPPSSPSLHKQVRVVGA